MLALRAQPFPRRQVPVQLRPEFQLVLQAWAQEQQERPEPESPQRAEQQPESSPPAFLLGALALL